MNKHRDDNVHLKAVGFFYSIWKCESHIDLLLDTERFHKTSECTTPGQTDNDYAARITEGPITPPRISLCLSALSREGVFSVQSMGSGPLFRLWVFGFTGLSFYLCPLDVSLFPKPGWSPIPFHAFVFPSSSHRVFLTQQVMWIRAAGCLS